MTTPIAATPAVAAPGDSGEFDPIGTVAQVQKGLAGVVADTTAIAQVDLETNSLTYRGHPVQDLCAQCTFLEVAHLLWHGDLPTAAQLAALERAERAGRALDERTLTVLRQFSPAAHPMDTIRTGISLLGTNDPRTPDNSREANLAKALSIFAAAPTIVAADYRLRQGQAPIAPREDLGYCENFFNMALGHVPEPEVVRCFDISLTLYAEHSFNASTFAARVVASTLADLHGAVVAGIAALKGPLHGGANEAVMEMMLEIDDPARARDWMTQALAAKRKVMGFGHRVYRRGDSRVPTMREAFFRMAALRDGQKWVEMYKALEDTMVATKGIYPNLDFPTGPAYYLMGFPINLFTPIFVMSRITGWTAHVIEQLADNRLIRPLSAYTGHAPRPVLPLDQR